MALGYQRASDLLRAKEYATLALAADPINPVALKNLDASSAKRGQLAGSLLPDIRLCLHGAGGCRIGREAF